MRILATDKRRGIAIATLVCGKVLALARRPEDVGRPVEHWPRAGKKRTNWILKYGFVRVNAGGICRIKPRRPKPLARKLRVR